MDRAKVEFANGGVRKEIPADSLIPRDYVLAYEAEVTRALANAGLAPRVIEQDDLSITTEYAGITIAALFDHNPVFKSIDGRPEAACAIIVTLCRTLSQIAAAGALLVDGNDANFALPLADMKRRSGRVQLQKILALDHLCTLHTDIVFDKPLLMAVAGKSKNPVIAPEIRRMIERGQAAAATDLGLSGVRELVSRLKADPGFLHPHWENLHIYYDDVPDVARAMQYSAGIIAGQIAEHIDLGPIRPVIDRMCARKADDRFASFEEAIAALVEAYPALPEETLGEIQPVVELTRPRARSSVLILGDSEYLDTDDSPDEGPPPHGAAPSPAPPEPPAPTPAPQEWETILPPLAPPPSFRWGRVIAASCAAGLAALFVLGWYGRQLTSPEGVLLRSQLSMARLAFEVLDNPNQPQSERQQALLVVAGVGANNAYVEYRVSALVTRHAYRAPDLIAKLKKDKSSASELSRITDDLRVLEKAGNAEAGHLAVAIDAAASGSVQRIAKTIEQMRKQPHTAQATAMLEQALKSTRKPS